jgi:kynureninase
VTIADRTEAETLDAADALASLREEFVFGDPDVVYLDGNSLGMLSKPAVDRLGQVVAHEWGTRLIRSWNEVWQTLPQTVGDFLGERFLGAGPGQVVVSDSTSVNLFKVASAALDARPGRDVIVTDVNNFPTDRYILEGLAAARGLELRLVEFDEIAGPTAESVAAVVDERTALVSLSQVDYRSSALADLGAVNAVVHGAGALVLWDLCHSVGAVPIDLDGTGTDLAVGCCYKYLNGGPGAPAFLYVSQELLDAGARQPIWGWFGQNDQFAMSQGYDPVRSATGFLVGTPNVIGTSLVDASARLLASAGNGAGVAAIRTKNIALTDYAVRLFDELLAPAGFELGSPRDSSVRGSHISVRHPEAYRICKVLIETDGIIPDFRGPDRVRLGFAAATTRFVDVHQAFVAMARIVAGKEYEAVSAERDAVT